MKKLLVLTILLLGAIQSHAYKEIFKGDCVGSNYRVNPDGTKTRRIRCNNINDNTCCIWEDDNSWTIPDIGLNVRFVYISHEV